MQSSRSLATRVSIHPLIGIFVLATLTVGCLPKKKQKKSDPGGDPPAAEAPLPPPSKEGPPVSCPDDCDDGNACTEDTCVAGACTHTPASCDDGNPCTTDSCDATLGCQNTPQNGKTCDDGMGCTNFDTCFQGQCVGKAINCDDGNECTTNTCIEGEGCVATDADGTPCDDRNPCTLDDACADRKCSGEWDTCDDGNECTDDWCAPDTGCVNANHNGKTCDDGNNCTAGDVCWDGACDSRTPVDCDDGNPCTTDSCDPTIGCVHLAADGPCDDGNLCTTDDHCRAGTCGGTNLNCDDGVACTTDSCDPIMGCTNTPAATCDDGNACTTGDTCTTAGCQGAPIDCKDGNSCTADSCDPERGCVNTPTAGPCKDGDKCTTKDHCEGGECVGTPMVCDDGNPCTTDFCKPGKGCKHMPKAGESCDDGKICTTDDACTKWGQCKGKLDSCKDGDQCTWDFCKPGEGCKHKTKWGKSCDDGDECTTADTCTGGGCAGKDVNCDDGNPCTTDSCDAVTGCINTPTTGASCDDGDACTTSDVCVAGECTGKLLNCDDGDQCTADSCDPATGCANAPQTGTTCDDGNACTVKDHCDAGSCSGMALDCNDGDQCTADSCDPATGCANTAQTGTPCDDGDACTENDTCAAGACEASPVNCDDGNSCTTDSCDSATGCANDPQTGTGCDDGDACTMDDTCTEGTCGGMAVNCDDGDQCTADSCDATSGCSNMPQTETPCDDGNACTEGDACDAGACNGSAVNCDDGSPCTTESCDSTTGCVYENLADGTPCDDSNACTINPCTSPVVERYTVHNAIATKVSHTPNSKHGFIFPGFFNGTSAVFTFMPGSTFDILDDGSAVMTATLKVTSGPSSRIGEMWEGQLTWSYRGMGAAGQGSGGPKKELKSGHQPKSVTNAWRYFDLTEGMLYRVGSSEYAELMQNPPNSKYPFQFGVTASGKNKNLGASSWFTYTRTTANGTSNIGTGDINCDMVPTDPPSCTPTDACEAGVCTGAPITCEDDDACTEDSCDPATGCTFDSLATEEVCDGADNDCDGAVDEGFDVGAICDPCGGTGVTAWAYSNDAQERPVIVAGRGFVLSGSTFADMFEHSFEGDEAYIDHFLDLLLESSGAVTPSVLGFYGAYDAGDYTGMMNVLQSLQDEGWLASVSGMDVSEGTPLDITAADLDGIDIVVLDAAPDAHQADFFVLTEGAYAALADFAANGGTIVASAYTMVHWKHYLNWERQLANVELAQLFGGVLPDVNYFVDSAWTTGGLGEGGFIPTLNSAKPGLSKASDPYFHFFWGLDLSGACTEPLSTLVCAADGASSVCE